MILTVDFVDRGEKPESNGTVIAFFKLRKNGR